MTGFTLFETIIYLHTLTAASPQLCANCFRSYYLPSHILHILKSYVFFKTLIFYLIISIFYIETSMPSSTFYVN